MWTSFCYHFIFYWVHLIYSYIFVVPIPIYSTDSDGKVHVMSNLKYKKCILDKIHVTVYMPFFWNLASRRRSFTEQCKVLSDHLPLGKIHPPCAKIHDPFVRISRTYFRSVTRHCSKVYKWSLKVIRRPLFL